MFVEVEHEVVGTQRMIGPLFELSKSPTAVAGPAPAHGEHSESVLRDLGGYSAGEIATLRADGVIQTGVPV